ncbi:MAG: precorrin-6A reductase [Clostridia bacterium]|nr:precorrin-6A reductase [Clostridia bacterium]
MYKICVFAGTTEGRELIEFLAEQPVAVRACVATDYGELLLPQTGNLTVSARRLTEPEMEALFQKEAFDLVIDATHPYALVVTENISAACRTTGTEYLRLLREETELPEGAVFAADAGEAAACLDGTEGNILLTTGSKEIAKYAAMRDFSRRVYARVLPMEDSLSVCKAAGLAPAHIFAMQGPFSKEMNQAMLRAADARWLVTKEGGSTGGFAEKAEAAREAGARLVVIGRPPQRDGASLSETMELLCGRFGLRRRPRVTVAGIGPGSREGMTGEAREAVAGADCLIGAGRMLEAVASPHQAVFDAIAPQAIAGYIAAHGEYRRFAVVMSGDTGFFSGTKKLLPLLKNCDVTVLPGLSSMAVLCARLGTSYEDVVPVSLHGRDRDIVSDVRRNPRVFALVGGEDGMAALCRSLDAAGLGGVWVSVGERLGYPDEKITRGTASALAHQSFAALSVALIENGSARADVFFGLPDNVFLRGGGESGTVPMTKSEVRAVCLSKLRLTEDAICWDIGAGTGSVSVEMARLARRGSVYAVEQREDALALLAENKAAFCAGNLIPVAGVAPECCADLPAPTHAFIGGSSGNLRDIVALLLEKNPAVRIVAASVTMESAAELINTVKEFDFTEHEIVSLTVARDRKAGRYHLMMGQNPVYLFTMQRRREQ